MQIRSQNYFSQKSEDAYDVEMQFLSVSISQNFPL